MTWAANSTEPSPRFAPHSSASSAAMATSDHAEPGALILGATAVTLPSRFVTVPVRSYCTLAGKTTSANASVAPPWPVTAITFAAAQAPGCQVHVHDVAQNAPSKNHRGALDSLCHGGELSVSVATRRRSVEATSRTQARSQAHVERAAHVRTTQSHEELCLR